MLCVVRFIYNGSRTDTNFLLGFLPLFLRTIGPTPGTTTTQGRDDNLSAVEKRCIANFSSTVSYGLCYLSIVVNPSHVGSDFGGDPVKRPLALQGLAVRRSPFVRNLTHLSFLSTLSLKIYVSDLLITLRRCLDLEGLYSNEVGQNVLLAWIFLISTYQDSGSWAYAMTT